MTAAAGNALALIPARGGSRSIPRKNVRPLGGRPLITWAIEAVQASGTAERICVSTDDDEIADVAARAGAEAPFRRPPHLSRDDSPSIDAVAHALEWYAGAGYEPTYVLVVQPTEPFVRPEQIRDAYELMLAEGADSAITIVAVPRTFHPFHVRLRDDRGFVRFEKERDHYAHPTRQSDPPRWAFGNLYWFRREAFLRERRLETSRCVGLPVDDVSALDVNTPDDWTLAEAVAASGRIDALADDPRR